MSVEGNGSSPVVADDGKGGPDLSMRRHSLEIAGLARFDIQLWEGGEGVPTLFLHGFEGHPGRAAFLTELARARRVLAPELPGYGYSQGFENFVDILDVAYFFRELIRSLGLEKVDVIGHSLGGMFAAELGLLAPQIVRKLVLVNSFGLWLDNEPSQDPFGQADRVAAAKWHSAPQPLPSNFGSEETGDEEQAARALFSARNLGSATKFMWPFAERGLRRRLPYAQQSILLIHGRSDGLVPLSYAREFEKLLPGSRVAVLDNAAHYPMVEQADEFVSTVTKFLDQD